MPTTPESARKRQLSDDVMRLPKTANNDSRDDSDQSGIDSNSTDNDDSGDKGGNHLPEQFTPTTLLKSSASPSGKSDQSISSDEVDGTLSPNWSPTNAKVTVMPVMFSRSPRASGSSAQKSTCLSFESYSSVGITTVTRRQGIHEVLGASPDHSKAVRDTHVEYTRLCTRPHIADGDSAAGRYVRTSIIIILTVAVSLICAVVLQRIYVYTKSGNDTTGAIPMPSCSTLDMFLQAFENITETFSAQAPHLWKTLRAGTRPIMRHDAEPAHPAVLLLVVPHGAAPTANCIMRHYADAVEHAFNAAVPAIRFAPAPDSHDAGSATPESEKQRLDAALYNGLSAGSRVAIIEHIEQLPAEAAMMLHAYCDNENAPFHRVAFLLVLHVEDPVVDSSIAEMDAFVEERLARLWALELGSNRFHPLMSRIANCAAFVHTEDADVLQQNSC